MTSLNHILEDGSALRAMPWTMYEMNTRLVLQYTNPLRSSACSSENAPMHLNNNCVGGSLERSLGTISYRAFALIPVSIPYFYLDH
jgi:hypothetical protein